MLWTIAIILLSLWAVGLAFKVAGALIHLLLGTAMIVALIKLLDGRRAGSLLAKQIEFRATSGLILSGNNRLAYHLRMIGSSTRGPRTTTAKNYPAPPNGC